MSFVSAHYHASFRFCALGARGPWRGKRWTLVGPRQLWDVDETIEAAQNVCYAYFDMHKSSLGATVRHSPAQIAPGLQSKRSICATASGQGFAHGID